MTTLRVVFHVRRGSRKEFPRRWNSSTAARSLRSTNAGDLPMASVDGGGLIGGVGTALKALKSNVRVVKRPCFHEPELAK